MPSRLFAMILTGSAVLPLLTCPGARAGEVGFATKPTAGKTGAKVKIQFAASAPTDAAVYVLDAKGSVVRHLVAGVLGKNPPWPLRPGLSQNLEWDGKDDAGKPASGGPFRVKVRLGTRPAFDGFMLFNPDATPEISSLAVGPKGNVYVTVPLRPPDRDFQKFFDGKVGKVPDYTRVLGAGYYWYMYMSGAIVKFPPEGGAFNWIGDGRAKNDFTGLPASVAAKPKRKCRNFLGGYYPHKTAEVQGAEWIRFDYSPYSETYPAGTPVCMCEGAGFDVDPFGRVFYTNLFRFRVEMIDTNNNFIGSFGKYGNQDSGGPGAKVKKPEIPLAWPAYVAVSDTHAYVNDTVNLRVVRVRLGCAAEETCQVR